MVLLAGLAACALTPAAAGALPGVAPVVETDPMHGPGDAADDAAVWVDPDDSSRSLLIGTDKSADGQGLALYGLGGHELAFYRDGRMNNVDVRYDVPLGSGKADIVGVSHRPDSGNKGGSFDFYRVNGATRTLSLINRVSLASLGRTDVMARGFALYRSPVSGRFYVFGSDSGKTDQYELDGSSGQIRLTWVRRIKLACPTEGLQADDELARLYVAEENLAGVTCGDTPPGPGIWRYGAEPGDDATGTLLAPSPPPDVKGFGLYYGPNGGGYLVAASQGDDSFHVYRRGDNTYVGGFKVIAGNGIDAVTGEDSMDVSSAPLGPAFPYGLFMTTDWANDGGLNQSYKVVDWRAIATALGLGLTTGNPDPRDLASSGPRPPQTVIDDGPQGTVTGRSARFRFRAVPADGATFACRLDGAGWSACDTGDASYSGIEVGTHVFSVRATAGGLTDLSPASRTWTVAAPVIPPVIPPVTPPVGGGGGGGSTGGGGSGPGAPGGGGPASAADRVAPAVSRLAVHPGRFRVAGTASRRRRAARVGTGAKLHLRVSERARIGLSVALRLHDGVRSGRRCRPPRTSVERLLPWPPCRRWGRATAILTRSFRPGAISVAFSGRVRHSALRPGRYRLTAVATDAAGNHSRPAFADFEIVR